jgi:hypothetical protein
MSTQIEYSFLESRPRSNYRQLWVKGRHMRAEVLYRCTVGPKPQSAEGVALDYDLPVEAVREAVEYVEAVREAVEYCERNKDLLDEERALESASIRARGLDRYPYAPKDYKPAE